MYEVNEKINVNLCPFSLIQLVSFPARHPQESGFGSISHENISKIKMQYFSGIESIGATVPFCHLLGLVTCLPSTPLSPTGALDTPWTVEGSGRLP